MIRLEEILDEVHRYNPDADLDLVKKAYVFSAKVHQGQLRRSGEPYLTHPLEVANILAKMHLDAPSIATGLLHDTVEDTLTTLEEVQELFGATIARLVDGVTKLSKLNFTSREQRQAENFRKMFLAMAEDIRVILVKLADRLHNMRTLQHMPEESQMKTAQETLEIYAPIAGRLGIQEIRTELEDLSFAHLKPDVWKTLEEKVEGLAKKSGRFIEEVREDLAKRMKQYGLESEINGRVKHLFSLFRKMEEQNLEFEQIYDLIAFRVIVDSVPQCYEALGVIHSLWKPVPGRFKDYIGMPKQNNYQSLHTTVVGPGGQRAEFQIRTKEMHSISEWGIAAHWKYKEGGEIDTREEEIFRWIRQFLEWQKELSDPAEYLDTVKLDLFATEVYVFTPKGEIKELPRGSTPVDFAYAIHTEVGNRCVGSRVNGRMMPLRYQMESGDTVEILTAPGHHPSKDWLKFVQSSRAKAKIRQYIREEERERSGKLGEEIFEKECARYDLNGAKLLKSDEMEKFLKEKGYRDVDQLLAFVSYGRISPFQVLQAVVPAEKLAQPEAAAEPREPKTGLGRFIQKALERSKGRVQVDGFNDVLVSLGKCCNPIPGESIVGFITRGRGVRIHRSDCSRALSSDLERRVDVRWDRKAKGPISTQIRVVCIDKPGLLADISKSISSEGVNISQATCRSIGDQKSMNTFEIGIESLKHLQHLVKSLEKIKGVISVERLRD